MVFVYKNIILLGEYGEKASSAKICSPSLLFLPTVGAVLEFDGSWPGHCRLLPSLFQDFLNGRLNSAHFFTSSRIQCIMHSDNCFIMHSE